MEVIVKTMERYDFPFSLDQSLIPNPEDNTTLFMCSGMQRFKHRFHSKDGGRLSTLQSCLRTNDLDLVGDGTHLSYFEMLGNFSFGNDDYERSVELWHELLINLNVKVDTVHIHPSQNEHKLLWNKLGYQIVDDEDCVWSDGNIGGYCCELYCGNLEIGNLVHTYKVSTDVGFGLERLVQVIEQKNRVDETSLFRQDVSPVVSDHLRGLQRLQQNGIMPGNKGRNYVCRRLLRRLIQLTDQTFGLEEWIVPEIEMRNKRFQQGRRMLRRHSDKSDEFWWDTFGILPEERKLL